MSGMDIAGPVGSASENAKKNFLVVGVGGSAGSIASFREFFRHVPADSGMAYVVILHLSPEHESRLAEVLQPATKLPVLQVREPVRVEPDHVYVIPPNKSLQMDDGRLVLSNMTRYEERRAPIDIFFRTLAENHDSRAVCVVMSGSGSDGTMGLRRVKEYNGLVLVQDPSEAAFGEMPRSCIATGLVDYVVPAAEMPQRILHYREQLEALHVADEAAGDDEQALMEVFTILRLRTGHDFTNYKRPTVLRRIERRMAVRDVESLRAYAALLRDRHDEAHALLAELLISVTNFFRDRQVWEKVEQVVLPKLLAAKRPEDHVRVWVPGCATGEEAYTIAMLLAEKAPQNAQVFATDLDEQAIARARDAWYSNTEVADVSPERLRRFFLQDGDGYRVRRELREMVLFAHHNLIKDPPFSHLDFISCRNLLIYLNRAAQQRALEVMHFALEPGGWLLLGTAEAADGTPSLFSIADKEAHIYQARAGERMALMPPLPRAVAPIDTRALLAASAGAPALDSRARERFAPIDLHHRLLEEYAAPSLVVDDQYDVVHLSERAGRYLQWPRGEATSNVLQLVRQELRIDLQSALFQAAQKRTTVAARGLLVHTAERDERIALIVRPALTDEDPPRGFFLIVFEDASRRDDRPMQHQAAAIEPGTGQFEQELLRVRGQMRATIEQYEVQAEEARAANEELQAMNEELRSTAEELETSQEELQSVNEELQTVNQELKVKIDEITHASDDLRNLMSSTDIGTIFVDRSFRVKLFTPRARDVFNLIAADVGRPLSDITHKLVIDGLTDDMARVIERLQSIEREVQTRDGAWYLMRLLPYRTSEDRIDGVVLTFLDITERHKAEQALRESEQKLRRTMNVDGVGVLLFDMDTGTLLDANDGFLQMSGYTREQVSSRALTWRTMTAPEHVGESEAEIEALHATGRIGPYEKEYLHADGSRSWMLFTGTALGDGTVVEYCIDVSDRKRAEEALRGSEQRYRTLFNAIDEGFCVFEMIFDDHGEPCDFRYVTVNAGFERQTGRRPEPGQTMREVFPEAEDMWLRQYSRVAHTGEPVRFVDRVPGLDRWFDVYVFPTDAPPERLQLAALFRDVTPEKVAEAELRESEKRQAFLLRFSDALRSEADADAVANRAIRMVCEQMQLDHCHITSFDVDNDRAYITHQTGNDRLPPWPREVRLSDFPEGLRVTSHRTLVIEDDFERRGLSEAERRNSRSLGMRALVAATLRKGENKPLWAIVAADSRPRRWTRGEIALIEEVTERTWAAIERVRAERAMRESEERQAFLLKVSDALRQLEDPREIQAAASRLLRERFDAGWCYYVEFDEAGTVGVILEDATREGLPSLAGRHDVSDVPDYLALLATGQALDVGSFATYELLSPRIRERYGAVGFRSMLATPLVRNRRAVALLVLGDTVERSWPESAVTLVRDVAERTWAAVELTRVRRRAEELNAFLVRFSDAVRGLADPWAVAEIACRLVAEELGVERAYWSEVDWATREYVVGPAFHVAGVPVIEGRFPVDAWEPLSSLHRAGRPVVVDDTQTDPRIPPEVRQGYAQLGIGADLAAPVAENGRLLCSLAVNQRLPRHWSLEEVALVHGVAVRCWAEVERARAEAALRRSETKYRTLFESIDEGFCVVEMLFDRDGQPVDFRFLEVNEAYMRHTGMPDPTGKLRSELAPATEPHWIRLLGNVARTGALVRHENYSAAQGRWYEMHASRVGGEESRQVAIVFNDVTERREREERQAFLLRFSDALRAEPDESSVKEQTVRMIAEHLRLDRCHIGEIFEQEGYSKVGPEQIRPDLPPVAGVYQLADFPETMRQLATQPMVVHDVFDDPRFSESEKALLASLGQRALLIAALRKGAQNVVWGLVAAMDSPRRWTEGERLLLEDAAERAWAAVERARAEAALREAEERYRTLFVSMDEGYAVVDMIGEPGAWTDFRVVEVNPAFEKQSGARDAAGRTASEILGTPNPRWAQVFGQVAETGEAVRFEENEPVLGRMFDLYVFRLGAEGSRRVAVLFTDITRRKQDEAALHESREQLEARVRERTRELLELSTQRQQLLERLVTATEEERQRIARELHDEMGQHITALRVGLESLQPQNERLGDLKTIITRIDQSIDRLTLELRPPALDQLGLHGAITSLADEFSAASGIRVAVHFGIGGGDRFSDAIESTLYRAVQESLTNVWKHASAMTVSVILERERDALRMIIEDDGRGFDSNAAADGAPPRGRFGLLGMRERPALVHGTLDVESEPGSGTTIYVRVPLIQPESVARA